jgi:hypothetical protein
VLGAVGTRMTERSLQNLLLASAAAATGWTGCGSGPGAATSSRTIDAAVSPADAGPDSYVVPSDAAGDASDAQSADDAMYSGVVLATARQAGTAITYSVFADFAPGAGFGIAQCDADAGACCCFTGATVLPGFDTPAAGAITVADDAATTATLSPAAVVVEGGTVSTSFQGTWELGRPWFDFPGVYMQADAGGWRPGDALQVSATGGQVDRFSGTLKTGALLAGVTPAIGAGAVMVDRSKDFAVAWTPEDRAGENVLFMLQQFTSRGALTCYCMVPDSMGGVTMSASMVGRFDTSQLAASVRLERLTVSTAPCDNASIDLVSEVTQSAAVMFQ